MKRILVPTDFTQASLNAYKYAIRLAEKMGSKVTLYHVFGSDVNEKFRPASLSEALEAGEEEAALSALEGYGYAVQRDLDIEVPSIYILEEGRPVKSIVAYADFMEADLIVMSTWWLKGAVRLIDTWLGNAGTKVIEQTSRPVLLVPEEAGFEGIDHIVYATNFQEAEQRIPEELVGLTKTFDVKISCVHVRRPDSVYDPIQFAFMRKMYRLELDNFKVNFFTINHENVIEGLDTFVEDKNASILAMMTHERLTIFDRLLGPGIPKQMAFHIKIPLLILHQKYMPI